MKFRRSMVLIVVLLGTGLAAFVGHDVESRLSPAAGFLDPAAESTQAQMLLENSGEAGPANLVLVVQSPGRALAEVEEAAAQLETRLVGVAGVADVVSWWSTGAEALLANDASSALVLAQIVGDEDDVNTTFNAVRNSIENDPIDSLDIGFAGQAPVRSETVETSEADLRRAELISFPLVLLVLLWVFRSPIAAALPLLVGVVSIIGTMATLRIATGFGSVSIFSLNLTTALGFGLAVDYCLLLISRYRSERALGSSDPMTTTMKTAGRAIAFSASTTAVALACLAFFPLGFLRSMAIAGPIVVLIAAGLALGVLPVMLRMLGPNLDRWTLPGRKFTDGTNTWGKLSALSSGRPKTVALVGIGFLALLAVPFLDARWGLADDRILGVQSETRAAHDEIRSQYSGAEFGAVSVVLPDSEVQGTAEIAMDVSKLVHIDRVASATGIFVNGVMVSGVSNPETAQFRESDLQWFSAVPTVDPTSSEGLEVVRSIRQVVAEEGLVGGLGARQIDTTQALTSRVPLVATAVMILTFLLLASLSRSIVVPIKALVLNVLSLTATLGAIVWVFQQGHLEGLFNFTPTGTVHLPVVMLVVVVAFGLSMDYEVFLVSRMREEYDRRGDTRQAIIASVDKTASVITASAVLIAIVFAAFLVADVTLIKMTGLGIALAVLVDAFVVRATLAPALLVLAGDANWWWPRSWSARLRPQPMTQTAAAKALGTEQP